ncbi:hypothetical protein EMIHUDRAFT_234507 [Emiliania huxleyi CCMP1516]|uniref:Protein kinase domain-containing protein n=2 Tax=Emiliania huxleyi TaxID=2903 RepID=A0A0D3JZA3_EMIH1|nr:hypothetical protein EMIHUDRAFT_234507 [Emiliania huxleyi CCMP1516]EOD28838.1 hypothetical protein EMIHUDRAFT_234507 [Emiliania huxleyi CCMP1516]|eukprot:XP_005781267.1 hypothetical protein EMIHUDRAFT_234507 [Emiliania huxleyi CCMP1516]
MSMEEMLCLAQRAAAGDSTAAAAHFKRLLERYRHHPAVQKRGREAEEAALSAAPTSRLSDGSSSPGSRPTSKNSTPRQADRVREEATEAGGVFGQPPPRHNGLAPRRHRARPYSRKTVLPLEAETAEDIKREIRILRECDCEHIDAFMREYQMRSTLWVVMRKMGHGFSEPCVACVCQGVLRALDYMHVERKAIHRDIKSANVLLTSSGTVKLADLGVAQLFNTMSKRGTMIGAPHQRAD